MKQIIIILFLFPFIVFSQQSTVIKGKVTDGENPIAFANITVVNTILGTAADLDGNYQLSVEPGTYNIQIQAVGFRTLQQKINSENYKESPLNFQLKQDLLGLEEVVVSATRNRIRKKDAPVIVNVLSPKLFEATQSISLADGLNYQPGVRVETNCQNCGFTQVRLNGLGGQYTQILVNSRPVFSALNGVYGLEQIPVSIIDRVEVVRSGGSALFGSNAIAGTVNVITKEPINNSWAVTSNLGLIDGTTADRNVNLNATVVSEDLTSGITVFGMFRDRDAYDANNDAWIQRSNATKRC